MLNQIPDQTPADAPNYPELATMLSGLLSGQRDFLVNSAQFTAFLFTQLTAVNWAGFYWLRQVQPSPAHTVNEPNERRLILGQFQGKPACVEIPMGKGVCGRCVESGEMQRIDDVHAFDGHIACDAASRSELVLPVVVQGELYGVLDLDSPHQARFRPQDGEGIARLLEIFIDSTELADLKQLTLRY